MRTMFFRTQTLAKLNVLLLALAFTLVFGLKTSLQAQQPADVAATGAFASTIITTRSYSDYQDAVKNACKGNLAVKNTDATEGTAIGKDFNGTLTLPEAKNGQSWICLMTLVSDDGCEMSIDNAKPWLEEYGKGHDISKGARPWPGVFVSGKTYDIKIHYSQVWYKPGINDLDGISVVLCLMPTDMAVDANRNGKIDDADVGMVTNTKPWDFWLNDNDDLHRDAPLTQRPDCSAGIVNGRNDLKDFFPISLDIQQLVKLLPYKNFPSNQSVKYKLKHADGAVKIVETHLSRDKAYHYLSDSEIERHSGYGEELRERVAYARKKEVTPDGVELSETFLRGIKDNNEGVILVEGSKPSTKPLVLVVEKSGVQVIEISLSLSLAPRILLLLHGMNSNTDTWETYVGDVFGANSVRSMDIRKSKFSPTAPATLPSFNIVRGSFGKGGVRCYRLQFGAFENEDTARTGVENLKTVNAEGGVRGKNMPYLTTPALQCGDFETFDQLAQEVDDAITLLRGRHPGAKIVLVGHSRGGLAGRKFLESSSANRAAVVGFLTTSSLHKGSQMGRIYRWLEHNPRHVYDSYNHEIMDRNYPTKPQNWQDWDVVDFLKNPKAFGRIEKTTLDIRRPVIDDMADWSVAITVLNDPRALANLPSKVRYGEISYSKVELGLLKTGAKGYSVFGGGFLTLGVSFAAADYILGKGNTPASFPGDGLIPRENQHFTELAGFPAPGYPPAPAPATGQNTIPRLIVTDTDVVHTEAPSRTNDLRAQLRQIAPNWFP